MHKQPKPEPTPPPLDPAEAPTDEPLERRPGPQPEPDHQVRDPRSPKGGSSEHVVFDEDEVAK